MTAARKDKVDIKFKEKWKKRKLLSILPLVSAWARRQQQQVLQQCQEQLACAMERIAELERRMPIERSIGVQRGVDMAVLLLDMTSCSATCCDAQQQTVAK